MVTKDGDAVRLCRRVPNSSNCFFEINLRYVTIYFFTVRDEHGYLCNYSAHGVELVGIYWPTVEHYFQAQKFLDDKLQARVRGAKSPGEAKRLGCSRQWPVRPDWDSVKDNEMYKAVFRKFQIHRDIRKQLLGTGRVEIIERAPNDYYWGCGKDGSGQNKLGRILMRVREELSVQRQSLF